MPTASPIKLQSSASASHTMLSPKVTVVESFSTPARNPSGLAWDGSSFWHSDGVERGPQTLYRLSLAGEILNSYPCPDSCCDTEFDGANIWQAAPHSEEILVINPANGQEVRRVKVNAKTSGLAFDGASYWRGDWARNAIIRFHPQSGMELEAIPTATPTSGLAYDGQYFWHGGELDGQQFLFKIDPDGAPVEQFELDFPAHGVTFDGNDLWVVDSANYRIAKLRIELSHQFDPRA